MNNVLRFPSPATSPQTPTAILDDDGLTRDTAIRRIREALRRRSGKTWSVTHGRGSASGWLQISAPPRRRRCDRETGEIDRGPGYYMSKADRHELATLLALSADRVEPLAIDVPASYAYRREYVDRAEGREPALIAQPYWD